jgi:hypothetical protein
MKIRITDEDFETDGYSLKMYGVYVGDEFYVERETETETEYGSGYVIESDDPNTDGVMVLKCECEVIHED